VGCNEGASPARGAQGDPSEENPLRSYTARKIVQILAILVCLAGGIVSHQLTLKHLPASSGTKTWVDRVCTAFETSSCDEVIKSRWSELHLNIGKVHLGMSTAQAGVVFFALMLCWFVFIGPVTARRWALHFVGTLVATVGLGFAVFFDVVMFLTLPKWCPLCATTHVASLLVFLFMLLLWPRRTAARSVPVIPALGAAGSSLFDESGKAAGSPPQAAQAVPYATMRGALGARSLEDARPRWTAVLTVAAVAFLIVFVQHLFVLTLSANQRVKAGETWAKYWESRFKEYDNYWQHTFTSWLIMPRVTFELEGVPVRGPANAPHTMVIFGDFQCPACALFETQLNEWIVPTANKDYGGLKVVFKHWPISPGCNKYTAVDRHPKACVAARAAEAARLVGGDDAFWKMHDLLFASRDALKDADEKWYVQKGQEFGLNADAFREAMNSKEAADRIAADVLEGETLGMKIIEDPQKATGGKETDPAVAKVDSTPAIYVDGKKVRSTHHKQMWKMILGSGRVPPRPAVNPSPGPGIGPLRPPEAPAQGVGPLRPPETGQTR